MSLNKPKQQDPHFDQRSKSFNDNGFGTLKEYELDNISRGLRGYFFERNRRAMVAKPQKRNRVIIIKLRK